MKKGYKRGSKAMDVAQKLIREHNLTREEFVELIKMADDPQVDALLADEAVRIRKEVYGTDVYTRGLIEFTNYCKNDCYYCGIRRSNCHADRYRLTEEEILSCCKIGYELGFCTFVLQGGEDGFYTDEKICQIVSKIKAEYPDCAVTLSIGEKSRESYQAYFDVGADRYLLRHETADEAHYKKLHPAEMSYQNRMRCLRDLKEIGYQTGSSYLICSDGVTDMLSDEEIREILGKNSTAEEKVEELLEMALAKGGRDNVTMVLAQISGYEERNPLKRWAERYSTGR